MVLFKEVKKPLIKAATSNGGDVSSARPAYTSNQKCAEACPCGYITMN